MIDKVALFTAIRTRLVADATLMAQAQMVVQDRVPVLADWSLPVIEFGEQTGVEDTEALAYGERGEALTLRLMCHARGPAPGVGSNDAALAALRRAELVLLAPGLIAANQTLWSVRPTGSASLPPQVDDEGFLRFGVGRLYLFRSVEA